MKGKRKTKRKNVIFGSIRKPVAPPTVKFTDVKTEARSHPAERKAKHKKDLKSLDQE